MVLVCSRLQVETFFKIHQLIFLNRTCYEATKRDYTQIRSSLQYNLLMYVYIVYYSIVVYIYIYIITTNNKYLWPFCTPKTHTIFPEQELFIQQCPKTFVFFVLRFLTKRTCETSLDGPSMMDSEMSLGFLG